MMVSSSTSTLFVSNGAGNLLRFGFATKPAENLCSAKMLGLQTYKKNQFTRGELGKGGYRATQFVLNDEAPNILSARS